MISLEDAKGIFKLLNKGLNIAEQEKLIDLREYILGIEEERLELQTKINDLEKALAFNKKLTFKAPMYYADGDETPYCPRCWEKDNKAIHVVYLKSPAVHSCPECKFHI
jgi:hypothetical protein